MPNSQEQQNSVELSTNVKTANQKQDEDRMSVGEHLDELRRYLMRSVMVLALVALVLFLMKGVVVDIVFAPLSPDFPTNRFFDWLATLTDTPALRINQAPVEIINTHMAGQFSLHIKSSIIAAIVLTFPYIIWQLWLFVRPALSDVARVKCRGFVGGASLWFFIGVAFGYFVIAPLAINFLAGYEVSKAINNLIDTSSYLGSVLGITFASALVFQLPTLVKLLAEMGIMKASLMRKYRRMAFVVIVILAAVITPPDVFSQVLIMIPLYILYEYGIIIADRIERRKALRESANEA